MTKKAWIGVAFLAAVVIAVAAVYFSGRSVPPSKVTIGRILPLTGNAASYGQSERKGTLLALTEVNSAGGINGDSLEIVFEDSQSLNKVGVSAMNKLVDVDKVPAVLGATKSGITLSIASIANQRKVLLLSPLSSDAAITNAGPFVYRVMPSDAAQSGILADWIVSAGYLDVAMLYINNAWGVGVAGGFEQAYKELGGTIVSTETCKDKDRDFRTQLTKISEAGPSALFCPTMPQEGGIILRQLRELGIALPVYGADAWSVNDLLTGASDAAEGVMYTYPASFDGPEYQAFADAFRDRYGEEPDVNAAGAYDAVKILAMCMNSVASDGMPLTGENIRQQMAEVRGYRGATGITTFDRNGDSIGKSFVRMIIRGGKREQYDK